MIRFKYLRRLRPRFSLRALFVLVTLCACAAGWMTYNMHLAREQRLAREEITKLWGYTRFNKDPQKLWVPDYVRSFLGDDFFLTVTEVTLDHPTEGRKVRPLTPEELTQAVQAMQDFPRLRHLSLSHTGIRDDDLALLAPLSSRIEELYIKETWLGGPFHGIGIKHLSDWPRLKDLTIHCNRWSDECDFGVLTTLPALERLAVGSGQLNKLVFQSMAACQNLKNLTLYSCSFDSISLSELRSCPNLESLVFCHTEASEYSVFMNDGANMSLQELRFSPRYGLYGPFNAFKDKNETVQRWSKHSLPNVAILLWN